MVWAASTVIGLGGLALGAYNASEGRKASSQAADAQTAAAQQSNDFQKYIFDKQTELNAPFRENGLAGQNRLMDLLGLSKNTKAAGYGSLNKQFGMDSFQQDPGYQWRLQQGQQGLDRMASARGGMNSGRAMKDAMNYNQGAASQEYGNAFNRFQTNRSNVLNPLQSLSGMAQTATNQMNTNAGNYGTNVGNGLMAIGDARGSGYLGEAAATRNGLNGAFNALQGMNSYNQLFPQTNAFADMSGLNSDGTRSITGGR